MPGVLKKNITAPVAQWKEQRSSKPKVVGSNPAGGAWVGVMRFDHNKKTGALIGEVPHLLEFEELV